MENIEILGASHITGGGFTENIPRSIPEGLCAAIHKGTWNVLPIFKLLKETASLSEEALYGTFNMGIGMTVIVRREEAAHAVALLKESGESAFVIGEIEKGSGVKIV
jgi:phosphoribosylformylglycinamidine cyclo-ligase